MSRLASRHHVDLLVVASNSLGPAISGFVRPEISPASRSAGSSLAPTNQNSISLLEYPNQPERAQTQRLPGSFPCLQSG
jgi:hypothetical protein